MIFFRIGVLKQNLWKINEIGGDRLNNIIKKTFEEINLQDPFFQSLRAAYPGFDDWFKRKSNQNAFVQYIDEKLVGFLYLKIEKMHVEDVVPPIYAEKY